MICFQIATLHGKNAWDNFDSTEIKQITQRSRRVY